MKALKNYREVGVSKVQSVNASATSLSKIRNQKKFLQDQETFELRRKLRLDQLKALAVKEEKKAAPYRPQLNKVSKALGEI